jgi:hypothetical protein
MAVLKFTESVGPALIFSCPPTPNVIDGVENFFRNVVHQKGSGEIFLCRHIITPFSFVLFHRPLDTSLLFGAVFGNPAPISFGERAPESRELAAKAIGVNAV